MKWCTVVYDSGNKKDIPRVFLKTHTVLQGHFLLQNYPIFTTPFHNFQHEEKLCGCREKLSVIQNIFSSQLKNTHKLNSLDTSRLTYKTIFWSSDEQVKLLSYIIERPILEVKCKTNLKRATELKLPSASSIGRGGKRYEIK